MTNSLVMVPVRLTGSTATIASELIAPGINVIPQCQFEDDTVSFTGRWTIGTASGYGIPASGCIGCARDSAREMAKLDADWTRADVLKTFTPEQRTQLGHAISNLFMCACDCSCEEVHCTDYSH